MENQKLRVTNKKVNYSAVLGGDGNRRKEAHFSDYDGKKKHSCVLCLWLIFPYGTRLLVKFKMPEKHHEGPIMEILCVHNIEQLEGKYMDNSIHLEIAYARKEHRGKISFDIPISSLVKGFKVRNVI